MGWANLSVDYPDAIGVIVVWYLLGINPIVNCDTALNTDAFFAWTQANPTNSDNELLPDLSGWDVDVQNIVVHEVLQKRSLENGDEAGIQEIYPGT